MYFSIQNFFNRSFVKHYIVLIESIFSNDILHTLLKTCVELYGKILSSKSLFICKLLFSLIYLLYVIVTKCSNFMLIYFVNMGKIGMEMLEMKNYIFDFDGTLADSEQCSIIATQQAFQNHKYKVPTAEQITYYMGVPIEKSFPLMIDKIVDSTALDELLATFRSIYQQIEQDTLRIFPKIEEVLQTLQEQKKRCFVLSSKKTAVLKRNLEILKIHTFFEDAIGSDRVTHYKPDPAGIFQIQKEHTIQLKNTVMIGDAIFDLQMGKAAGVHTCAVTWGSHSKEALLQEHPDWCIDEPTELITRF